MFTTTLTALAAAAALHTQTVAADTVTTPAVNVASPTVTAIAAPAQPKPRVAIPGTFAVDLDSQDAFDGVRALYVVRSGDGA